MVDPARRGAELRAARRGRRARPLRLLRGAGLHADAAARGRGRRDRARLHGAPPGHDAGRDRQRAARRRDARALPRRADRAGDRAAAAGAHAARRRGGASAGGGGRDGGDGARAGAAGGAAIPFRARRHAAGAPALERPLRGDADGAPAPATAAGATSAVTRWREDVTRDDWGTLRLPARRAERRRVVGRLPAERRRAGRATRSRSPRTAPSSSRRDGTITTTLEVVVSPEDDAEVRRVSIANHGQPRRARSSSPPTPSSCWRRPRPTRRIRPSPSCSCRRSTSPSVGALLATRRRRSPAEPEIWAAHLAVVEGEAVGDPEFETDRARFLGRGREVRAPIAVMDGRPLSEHASARCSIRSSPCAAACGFRRARRRASRSGRWSPRRRAATCSTWSTSITTPTAFERAATLAWTQAQVQLRHLGIDAGGGEPLPASRRLTCSTPIPRCGRRPTPSGAAAAGRPALWAQGISGDLPIVLRADRRAPRISPSSGSCCAPTSTGG